MLEFSWRRSSKTIEKTMNILWQIQIEFNGPGNDMQFLNSQRLFRQSLWNFKRYFGISQFVFR